MPLVNWRTSLAAVAPLMTSIGMIARAVSSGQMPDNEDIAIIFGFLTTALGLFAAKDKQVTGGSVSSVTGESITHPVSLVDEKINPVRFGG